MMRTIEAYPAMLDLVAALLKCLLAFVSVCVCCVSHRDNHECRVDSGATSTNGIQLFKKTALVICGYARYLLNSHIDFAGLIQRCDSQTTAPDSLFRCARLLLQVMNTMLSGRGGVA